MEGAKLLSRLDTAIGELIAEDAERARLRARGAELSIGHLAGSAPSRTSIRRRWTSASVVYKSYGWRERAEVGAQRLLELSRILNALERHWSAELQHTESIWRELVRRA